MLIKKGKYSSLLEQVGTSRPLPEKTREKAVDKLKLRAAEITQGALEKDEAKRRYWEIIKHGPPAVTREKPMRRRALRAI